MLDRNQDRIPPAAPADDRRFTRVVIFKGKGGGGRYTRRMISHNFRRDRPAKTDQNR